MNGKSGRSDGPSENDGARAEDGDSDDARSGQESDAALVRVETSASDEPIVVGVGASAGALDAFRRLLESMPDDAGIALVLVQHLDPSHESLMAELLAKHTSMRVVEAENASPILANHVYMIPPNRFIRIAEGKIFLDEPTITRGVRLPIDHLFRSLARELAERSICVVLSGTGSDGAAGVREVKAAGGMTVAQSPDAAEYDGMPRAAISTGSVDFVLPIEKMSEAILSYVKHPYLQADPNQGLADTAPDHFRAILSVLRAYTDHDFTRYRKGTITRRIERRMGIRHIADVGEYLRLLREDSEELQALFKDLLIGVTRFFRDPEVWNDLSRALYRLILRKPEDEPIRVWTPGCSTGEESYSIAILLLELLQRAGRRAEIQVFATDIDADAISVARLGSYPENVIDDVSAERLDANFQREGQRYRVRKKVRESCIFAVQNLLSDPPFSNLDLVTCRNVLIYLEPDVQNQVLDMFHFALRSTGLLMLGTSESPPRRKGLFKTVARSSCLYERGAKAPNYERLHLERLRPRPDRLAEAPSRPGITSGFVERFNRTLLDMFAPASVVVDRSGRIQYLHGPVREYLDFPLGEPDLDLEAMAVVGLKESVRSVLQKVRATKTRAVKVAKRIDSSGRPQSIEVRGVPLPSSVGGDTYFLVSFVDIVPVTVEASAEDRARTLEGEERDASEAQHLALELQATREDLQSTIEELESANEELKASNEEVMSMNEELQSTNEELETSREELQSLNEELSTVNNQLHAKIEELESANNDLNNFLASTDIAMLFLDENLCIRRFTEATTRLLSVRDSDVGRKVSDLASRVDDPDLISDAQNVLAHLTPIEREVESRESQWFMRRVMPFRTASNRIEGVVVTLADISQIKDASNRAELRERQQALIAEIGRSALRGEDLDALYHRITRDLVATLSCTFSKILRLEPDRSGLRLVAGVGWQEGLVGEAVVPAGYDSQGGYTLESSAPVVVEGLSDESRFSGPSLLVEHGIESGVSVLVGPEDEPWGVLAVHSRERNVFTADDAHFVAAIANVLWEAIRQRSLDFALQRSESRWRFALESANAGAWELRLPALTAWTSEQHDRIFGYTDPVTDWTFDRFLSHVLEDDRLAVEKVFREVPDKTEGLTFECRIRRVDGEVRWIRACGAKEAVSPHGDDRMWGMVEDVTPRKQAELALEESERRTRLAMRAAEFAFWEWDVAGDRLVCDLADSSDGAAIFSEPYLAIEAFLARIDEGDRDRVKAAVDEALETDKGLHVDFRLVRPDGSRRWILGRGSVRRDSAGNPVSMMGISIDVTARKDAERALRRSRYRLEGALQGGKMGTWEWNVLEDRVSWNEFATDADPSSGDDEQEAADAFLERLRPEDRARFRASLEAMIESDSSFDEEIRMRVGTGDYRWVAAVGQLERGEYGEPQRVFGVNYDVTERHEAQAALERAIRAAEEANRAKSVFLANMSHEIRTPLTAVLGYAELLEATLADRDAQACASTIVKNGRHLCEIIDDILDLSKIQYGRGIDPQIERCSIIEILADVHSLMSVHAAEKALALSVEFAGEIPDPVYTSRKRVRQILLNLVGNAIKFTDRGSVSVVVKCLAEDEMLAFEVIDTGVGIAAEDHESLFEPFMQLDQSLRREQGGSGLGLAISKELTESLGGTLTVESTVGKGSIFRFTTRTGDLSEVDWLEPDPDSIRTLGSRHSTDGSPRIRANVLVVDDHREVRYLLRRYLEAAGSTVESADNGEACIERLDAANESDPPIHAVLLDLNMPKVDGISTAKRLRAAGYSGPIIALTANVLPEIREECRQVGFNDFVSKPIDREKLLRKLSHWTRTSVTAAARDAESELRILCVEDHSATGQALRALLAQFGHRVETATSGARALEITERFFPDVALVDLGLTDLSGSELLVQLKAKPSMSSCAFICYTGRDENEVDWRELGFDAFLAKPASAREIRDAIERMRKD